MHLQGDFLHQTNKRRLLLIINKLFKAALTTSNINQVYYILNSKYSMVRRLLTLIRLLHTKRRHKAL